MIRFTSDFGKNSRISRLHSRARNALNFHKSNLAFRVNQQVFSFKPCLISSNILLLRSSNFRHFVLIYAHAFGFRAHCNDFTMLLNTVFSWIEEAAASIFFLSKKMRLLFEGGFYSGAASIKFEYLKERNFRARIVYIWIRIWKDEKIVGIHLRKWQFWRISRNLISRMALDIVFF